EPLPAEAFPLYLAWWQGLARRGGDEAATQSPSQAGRERLQQAIEKLLGLPLAAELVEAELLPARVPGYQPAWLDALFLDSDLAWFGHGPKVVSLAFADQLELLRDELAEPGETADPPVPAEGRYPFTELLPRSGLTSDRLAEALWSAVWRGEVSNDSFAALRLGVGTRFRPRALADESTRQRILERPGTGGRGGFRRWQASRPFHGNWYRLPPPEPDADPISRLERDKDRARLLLDRYGILFRELLAHELTALQWGRLFRALRLMELSGEIVSGLFFDGIPGLQFAGPSLPAALRRLPDEAIWWLNAVDPASPCGLRLGGLDDLPERRVSNHLVYHGRRLVLISRRGGKELEVRVPPDAPRLAEYLAFLEAQQTRPGQPVRHLTVEAINGEPARESAYLPALRERFETTADDRGVKLWRQVR
ncbi:MAG: ATP-dependent helicase, partial [Armatimonadetes bacterium]|nr:ATP-dependent helicase [Armatimonadota bacterium]